MKQRESVFKKKNAEKYTVFKLEHPYFMFYYIF